MLVKVPVELVSRSHQELGIDPEPLKTWEVFDSDDILTYRPCFDENEEKIGTFIRLVEGRNIVCDLHPDRITALVIGEIDKLPRTDSHGIRDFVQEMTNPLDYRHY